MRYRRYDDKLDPDEIRDIDLRKGVFRAMTKDFLARNRKLGLTDAPGTLARMLEQAYRAGMQVAQLNPDATATDKMIRRMTLLDLPSLTHGTVERLKLAFFGSFTTRPNEREPEAKHLFAFMSPGDPRYPSISRDLWRIPGRAVNSPFSNKAFAPLIKAGLYELLDGEPNSLRIAILTEWGFELLATGETSLPDDRVPDHSSTYPRYWELYSDLEAGYEQAANDVFNRKR